MQAVQQQQPGWPAAAPVPPVPPAGMPWPGAVPPQYPGAAPPAYPGAVPPAAPQYPAAVPPQYAAYPQHGVMPGAVPPGVPPPGGLGFVFLHLSAHHVYQLAYWLVITAWSDQVELGH